MKISLRTLLIGPFLLQVLGITGLVGYLSYRSGQRAVESMASQLMTQTGQRVQDSLNTYLQIPKRVTQVNGELIQSGQLNSDDLTTLESHFVQQLQFFPSITGLAMANEAGAFLNVARSNDATLIIRRLKGTPNDRGLYRYQTNSYGQNPTLLEPVRYDFDPHRDPPHQPWYEAAQATPDGLWRVVVTLQQGQDKPLLAMVRFNPVYNPQGQLAGVVSTGILLTEISAFLQRLVQGHQGQVFVIEPNGNWVATSTGEVTFDAQTGPNHAQNVAVQPRRRTIQQSSHGLTQAVAKHLFAHPADLSQIQQPQFSVLRLDRQRYFVQITPLQADLNWLLVTVVPTAQFMEDIYANLARTALLCALALLGSIGLGLWTAEYITKPILSLQQATQAFTGGLAVVPPTQPTHIEEVEALRQQFDQMVGQLVSSFRTLRDRENTLATFLNGVPVAISVHDPSGQLLFLNDKGRKLLVKGLVEAASEQLSEVYQLYVAGTDQLYPTEQLPVVKGLRGITDSTNDIEIDVEGRRVPLEVHTIPVFDSDGQVLYAINAFQDITERRQAEQLRANYERELEQRVAEQTAWLVQGEITQQALINAIPDLLMRLGRAGVPLEIYNLDAVNWIGNKAEIYQKTMYENLPPDIANQRQRCVEAALTTGTIQRHEYEFSFEGKIYYEEARIVPVTQDEVLVVVRDISDRRKVDRLKDEFIAIVSHELRTPLTAIRGALGILDSGVLNDRPEKNQHMLKMSLLNTERLIRLVDDILNLERLASGKVKLVKELCQVSTLMQLAVDGVEAIALEAAVILYVNPLEATVWAAPDTIVQALTNLLSNAIKFSTPGSKVWLKAEAIAPSPNPPAFIRFSVTDEGRGIPADRLEAIFDRFQQVDVSDSRQRGGTGLGLAICKSIVEQHGGELWVESVLGQGSTFYFTLPVSPP
jgi:signal transduction histidine kinase